MPIVKFQTDNLLELKKPHPCGNRLFRVSHVGSEVKIVCTGCGRDLILDRIKLEKAIRKVIPSPSAEP